MKKYTAEIWVKSTMNEKETRKEISQLFGEVYSSKDGYFKAVRICKIKKVEP